MPPASPPAPAHPLIAIGASFGGVQALIALVQGLPKDFPAFVAIVQHVGTQPSILPELLSRAGPLPARHPRDGEEIRTGTVYVAPPDHHLLVGPGGTLHLSRGPRENHARPAIDPLFRTAALHWGSAAIGVVLTGELDDGTAGLAAIKACGGVAVVQDPQEAVAPSMPASALANVDVDHCLLLPAIIALLPRLAGAPPAAPAAPPPEELVQEQRVFEGVEPMENLRRIGTPTQLTCPECGGTLSEMQSARPLRFRCHTGHAYTAASLDSAQAGRTDHAIQSSLRTLQEREMLLRRMAAASRGIGDEAQAEAGLRQAERVRQQADRLLELIAEGTGGA